VIFFFFFDVGTILAIEGIVALILLVHLEGNVAITIVKVRVAMSLVRGRMVLRNRILGGTHHQKRMKLYIKKTVVFSAIGGSVALSLQHLACLFILHLQSIVK